MCFGEKNYLFLKCGLKKCIYLCIRIGHYGAIQMLYYYYHCFLSKHSYFFSDKHSQYSCMLLTDFSLHADLKTFVFSKLRFLHLVDLGSQLLLYEGLL